MYKTVQADEDKNKVIVGNTCTFTLFVTVNLLLFLQSLAVIALGIYLWVQVGSPEVFSITFIALGLVECLVAYVGWTARSSTKKLFCYILFLGVIWLCQLVSTILGIVLKDKMIEMAAKHLQGKKQESFEELEKLASDNIVPVLYATISAVVIQLICLLFSVCYRKSLRSRKDDHYHNLEVQERRDKMQQQQTETHAKYEAKRQMYRDKYNY